MAARSPTSKLSWFARAASVFDHAKDDIEAFCANDPAARSGLEVILLYPGLHALWMHRVAHALWTDEKAFSARVVSHLNRFATGIEIHPAATVGRRVVIDHGMGIVIGETATIGDGCLLYKGVVLGGTTLTHGKRHPQLGAGVVVGSNACILGFIEVGDGARVGSGSVVVRPVPPHATVVGVPARIVAQDGKPILVLPERPKADSGDDAVAKLQRQIERLELRLNDIEPEQTLDESWSWVI
jgi:serine O-acetyltransferase